MTEIERVSCPSVVDVVAWLIREEPIVGAVVDAFEGKGRPEFVPLGGVVVDDVQDDFETAVVEAGDHLLKFAQRVRNVGRITRIGRKKSDRVIAPIVLQPLFEKITVVNERMDGQQFHRGHAQRPDVVDDRLGAQSGVKAPQILVDRGIQLGEPFDVGFVDDRLVPRHVAPTIFAAPIEVGIDHNGPGHERSAVALIHGQIPAFTPEPIAENRWVPHKLAGMGARVRVKQELVRIKSVTCLGLVRTVRPEAIKRPRADLGYMTVEDFVGVLREFEPLDLSGADAVEDANLDPGCVG
jgi:hypothetical protein